LQIFILFTIVAFGLTLLGVKYALTIAAFAAFINLIPYLGPFLGLVFGVFVVLSTGHPLLSFNEHLLLIVQMLPVFATAQLMDNLLLQPIIFSKSVKAHPLEIFIIIFVGASLADMLGMIAAIPVYTVLRVGFIELGKGYRQYYIFRSHQLPIGHRSASLEGGSKKRYF
ncbi:MAG: AI-2E family transporter, partial [Bacteroidota bacterium]